MTPLKGNKFLVTGGAGFIGSHICEELVRQKKQVVVLDNVFRFLNFRGWYNNKFCQYVEADVTRFEEIRPFFDGVDVVFHEACSKCTVCREDPVKDLMTNALGSYNVFEAARQAGVKKVIHASTGSVNGGALKSFYGVSKQAGENYLKAFREYYSDFRFTAIRYHHVYGPRQNADPQTGGVIPIFITQMLKDEPITIHGDGEQQRHFTYVKDVVDFNFRCESEFHGEFIDLAEHTPTTLNQLVAALSSVTGKKPIAVFKSARAGDIKTFNVGRSLLPDCGHEEYDDRFRRNLKEMVEWYASQKT